MAKFLKLLKNKSEADINSFALFVSKLNTNIAMIEGSCSDIENTIKPFFGFGWIETKLCYKARYYLFFLKGQVNDNHKYLIFNTIKKVIAHIAAMTSLFLLKIIRKIDNFWNLNGQLVGHFFKKNL